MACFPWYDSTNAPTWILNVPATARYQVDVDMWHRLAGRFTVIDPDIEALNRAVLMLDVRFHLVQ